MGFSKVKQINHTTMPGGQKILVVNGELMAQKKGAAWKSSPVNALNNNNFL